MDTCIRIIIKLVHIICVLTVAVTCVFGCRRIQLDGDDVTTIRSHADFNNTHYENNTSACWRILADGGCNVVQLQSETFQIQTDDGGTCLDSLRIYDGRMRNSNLEAEYCGTNFTYVESSSAVMMLQFTSDASITQMGFKLRARSSTKSCTTKATELTTKLAIILGTVIGSGVTIIAIITIVWYVKKKPSNDKIYVRETRGRSIELGSEMPGYDPKTYSQETSRSTSSHHIPKLDLFATPRTPPPKYERTHTSRTSLTSLPRSTARSVLSTRRLTIEDTGQTVHSVRVTKMAGNGYDMEVISHLDHYNGSLPSHKEVETSHDLALSEADA